MEWFRLYSNVITNAKVQTLPLDVRWRWIECCCMANRNPVRGRLPGLRQVAFEMRVGGEDAAEILATLESAGLLDRDGGHLVVHDWDQYQPPSDNAAERMRKLRANRKAEPVRNGDGIGSERVPNVFRTCSDKKREEEIREDPPTPPNGGPGGGGLDSPDEPFHAPPPPTPPPALTESDRIARRAEEVLCGMGSHARRWCDEYKPAWVAEAVELAATKGVTSPVWVGKVLARYKAQGKSDAERYGRPAPGVPEKRRPEDRPIRELMEEHRRRAAENGGAA